MESDHPAHRVLAGEESGHMGKADYSKSDAQYLFAEVGCREIRRLAVTMTGEYVDMATWPWL